MGKELIKKRNQATLLALIKKYGPISRKDLLNKTTLTTPTFDRHLYHFVNSKKVTKTIKDNKVVYYYTGSVRQFLNASGITVDELVEENKNKMDTIENLINGGLFSRGMNSKQILKFMIHNEGVEERDNLRVHELNDFVSLLDFVSATNHDIEISIKIKNADIKRMKETQKNLIRHDKMWKEMEK